MEKTNRCRSVNDKALTEEQKKHIFVQKATEQEEFTESVTYQKKHPEITEKQLPDYQTSTFTCTECGKIAGHKEFYMTQGETGICNDCIHDPEILKKIIENMRSKG